ncbi:MAG: rod shape-determining protein RodA [Lachnospiraceae bacterium]|nr:rod shape-determining protein RodA [Lachnospiraceae bacterium]
MFKFEEYRLRYFNFRLLLYIALLVIAGVIFVKSATMNSSGDAVDKKILGIVIGGICMLFVALVDYHFWLKIWPLIYLACLALLIAVFTGLGAGRDVATRWIDLGPVQIQPSEFAKIGLILCLAGYYNRFRDKVSSFPVVMGAVVLFGGIALLVYKQPNLSTTLVITFVFVVLVYVSGISYKWVLGVLAACVPVGGVLIYSLLQPEQGILQGYQMNRITAWLYPDQVPADLTRQVRYSVQAIASGQLHGKGLFNTTLESVKNGNFLSEEDCDFIFAVIGEEVGFYGSVFIIALFVLVVLECIWLAIRARDLAGRLICMGMGSLIAFQAFVNIGVATRLLPNTGLPLPFISAGLSSLLSLMIGMGLVFNVGLQRKRENT